MFQRGFKEHDKGIDGVASIHKWKNSFESPASVELSLSAVCSSSCLLRPSLHYVGIESVLNVVGLACR